MKIYVSEKDLSPIQINQIKEYGEAAHYFRADIERYVKIAVSSLEQHEQEIRKPLEEEIAILKQQVNDWKQRFNSSEERYSSLSQSSVECIQKKEEHFKKEQNKVAMEKLEEVLKKVRKVVIVTDDDNDDYSVITLWGLKKVIKPMIKELKGGEDE